MIETEMIKSIEPQCQHFVVRKKRLCRMTVRPGRSYCGEHEPKPVTADGEDDTRIPCPYDSKHTCYASKLERHLEICNARPTPAPQYIQKNINAPSSGMTCERKPLSQVPMETILRVVHKVHQLYEAHIAPSVTTSRPRPIHAAVIPEFTERGRTEASLRHLRQASSLLHIAEDESMVQGDTCYVELGAGKGQLSLFAWRAWCEPKAAEGGDSEFSTSSVLLVDRAALRHKRDAKMRAETTATDSPCALGRWRRVRADLADVCLRDAAGARAGRLVGLAKHLCGAATDFALRSLVQGGASGAVMATCCHHRCELKHYCGAQHLMELGLSPDELSVMLGIVSWATCGDGRPRRRTRNENDTTRGSGSVQQRPNSTNDNQITDGVHDQDLEDNKSTSSASDTTDRGNVNGKHSELEDLITSGSRIEKSTDLDSRLQKTEHESIQSNTVMCEDNYEDRQTDKLSEQRQDGQTYKISFQEHYENRQTDKLNEHYENRKTEKQNEHYENRQTDILNKYYENRKTDKQNELENRQTDKLNEYYKNRQTDKPNEHYENRQTDKLNEHYEDRQTDKLSEPVRAEAGRRAKALLDWGRALYLKEHGFDARLCHFVPASVSLENVCIVAKR